MIKIFHFIYFILVSYEKYLLESSLPNIIFFLRNNPFNKFQIIDKGSIYWEKLFNNTESKWYIEQHEIYDIKNNKNGNKLIRKKINITNINYNNNNINKININEESSNSIFNEIQSSSIVTQKKNNIVQISKSTNVKIKWPKIK